VPAPIGLVHLVWAPYGTGLLERFLSAYADRDPGRAHRLTVVLNGFSSRSAAAEHERLLVGIEHDVVLLERPVQDLSAYRAAARTIRQPIVCFLNSWARPLSDGWLDQIVSALEQPGAGIAAATGSWGSQLDYLRFQLGLPSAYAAVYDDREATRQAFLAMSPAARDRGIWPHRLLTAWTYLRQLRRFDRFPAPHIRTNAFAIQREVLLGLHWPRMRSKLDAYAFENGRRSLTAQIRSRGLRALVAGRDGVAYDVEAWPDSATLWQRDQENLLVADNQTDSYADADLDRRTLLSRNAWADRAQPAAPG
jgi:hypothetical protein